MNIETVEIKVTNPWLTFAAPRWLRVVEHFLRVRILRQPSYLIDLWTIENAEEIESVHGLDLEQELANALIQEMKNEGIIK